MNKNLLSFSKRGVIQGMFFFFCLILATVSFEASAQRDLIVTQAGENIRCRILEETPARFVFAYVKGDKIYRSEIFKNLVTSFKFNYYSEDLPNAKNLPKAKSNEVEGEPSRSLSVQPNEPTKTSKKVAVTDTEKKEKVQETPPTTAKEKKMAQTAEQSAENKTIEPVKSETKPQQLEEKKTVTRIERGNSSSQPTTQSVAEEPKTTTEPTTTKLAEKPKEETPQKPTTETKVAEAATVPESPTFALKNDMKFRVGIRGGIGNRLAEKVTSGNTFDLYKEKLLRGYEFGVDGAYFFSENAGVGAVYSNFKSRNQSSDITYINELTGNEATGSIANSNTISFVGPSLFFRKKLDFKTYVVASVAPGMFFYKDNGRYEDLNYTFKGKGYGAAATLGIDFLLGNDIIGRDVILSFEAGYNYGKINALNYGDNRGDVALAQPMDLSRLDFSVGLRFTRFPKYLRLTSY